MDEPIIKFVKMKNIDQSVVQVLVYAGRQEAGTLILRPEEWEHMKQQTARSKIRCEE